MTVSVRFSPDLEGKLTEYGWLTGTTKEAVRRTAMAAIRRRRTA